MEEQQSNIHNHYEAGSNCQVFNGNVSGCVFAMPGSTVNQYAGQDAIGHATDREPAQDFSAPVDEARTEELCHFIHPSVESVQEWVVHDEVKRLVRRQGLQEICQYLQQMAHEQKILLPQMPSVAYAELVRMGMPSGEGYSESTFRKYYNK